MSFCKRVTSILFVLPVVFCSVYAQNDSRVKSAALSPGSEAWAETNPALVDPLVRVLVTKGVLTPAEGASLSGSGTPIEQRNRLAALLRDKGLISLAEFEAVRTVVPSESTVAASAATIRTPAATPSEPPVAGTQKMPAARVNAAFVPVRLLPLDTPKREGLIPDVKLGSGVRLKLYGQFKASLIHDSSSPQGNDFRFRSWLVTPDLTLHPSFTSDLAACVWAQTSSGSIPPLTRDYGQT